MKQPTLKPQDLVVGLRLAIGETQPRTYQELSRELALSASEIHGSTKRLELSRLAVRTDGRIWIARPQLLEFVTHGAPYCFPAQLGAPTRGIPTAHGTRPLEQLMGPSSEPSPVWPYASGLSRGPALVPLYPSVPALAVQNSRMHELLALFDAIRAGASRERNLAIELLERALTL